jgi:glucose/arabinose dehydrogenase
MAGDGGTAHQAWVEQEAFMGWRFRVGALGGLSLLLGAPCAIAAEATPGGPPLAGEAAFGDWTKDGPGIRRRLTPTDLPPPFASRSAGNGPRVVSRPSGATPKVPSGFKVELFAAGLVEPRLLRTAPNGDVFVTETQSGNIKILRAGGAGATATVSLYARRLDTPFGLAFYPPGPEPRFLYVATLTAVLRFPYGNGDEHARAAPETVMSGIPEGGHWTRDLAFSRDGRQMYLSVGSFSNDQENAAYDEALRANILVFNAEGGDRRQFATGLRNPVGLAVHPVTGDLWTAVNERDGLGDNLPPDYVTRVREGGFYGWPWYYIGANQDPHHRGEHADLAGRVAVPDVLIQPHSAPLQLAVYTGTQFPDEYRNDLFVALHGSWNRARRTGYKLVRVLLREGQPTGEYEDFLIGFVTAEGNAWGRPVGVAVAADGSLLVSEDANGTVWRISYVGG